MRVRQLVLVAAVFAGCGEPTGPGPLLPGYGLSLVDGHALPVPYGEDGTLLVSNSLLFDGTERPRAGNSSNGTVRYALWVRRPGSPIEFSEVGLSYVVEGAELRINLCPPLALCFASTELIGPISGDRMELILTHYLAGRPGSVYRYVAALRE